ncbi:acclimation of photosynthesis to environment [Abeliophyllum distichum]|uniref:Acclimation of photosynthesis to environment n=1 Tax=Abeliophyllum distichum TaxID=126358 RepID=A0ABD1RBK5_9LAMI
MPVKAAAVMGGGGIVLCSRRFNLPSCSCLVSLKPQLANPSAIQPNFSSAFTNQRSVLAKPHHKDHHDPRLGFVLRAADSTQSPSTTAGTADKSIVPDAEFSLAKVSFGVIGLGFGVTLLSYGFGAYFNILPGSEWSALMLTYGFPLAIIGMALKYAELKPVPCLTYSDAYMLREKCATPILKQVRNDVTRYRYGDEQHLEEALKRIFQYGMGGGIPRRSAPVLQMIREEVTEDGKYCLVLVFEAKALQFSDFEQRQAKFTSFFGPGITAEVLKGEKDLYEVRLISNTTL